MAPGIGTGIGLWNNVAALSGGGGSTATWNPATSSADFSFSNGNLSATKNTSGGQDRNVQATSTHTSGDWTATWSAFGTAGWIVGFVNTGYSNATYIGQTGAIGYESTGNIYANGGTNQTGLATYTATDSIKCSISGGSVQFYKNGVAVGSAVNVSSFITNAYPAASSSGTTGTVTASFSNWP